MGREAIRALVTQRVTRSTTSVKHTGDRSETVGASSLGDTHEDSRDVVGRRLAHKSNVASCPEQAVPTTLRLAARILAMVYKLAVPYAASYLSHGDSSHHQRTGRVLALEAPTVTCTSSTTSQHNRNPKGKGP